MFPSVRWCAEPMTQLPRLKVTGHRFKVIGSVHSVQFDLNLLSNFHYLTQMFLSVRVKQNLWLSYVDSRSWSHFKVIYPSICVHSISPKPFKRFSLNITQMFLSVSRCAEHMTQLPRLKVTGLGQGIYHWISYPLHISWSLWMIFIKLHLNITLSETMCWSYDSATQTLGQGRLQGNLIDPSIPVRSISSEPFERFSLDFTQIFLSVRGCAELMTLLCRLKVKVTLQGSVIYPLICFGSITPEPFKRF